jgi:hypothetical protein
LLRHAPCRHLVAAESSAQTFSLLNARSSDDNEDPHRQRGEFGHGGRPRVRTDWHDDTPRHHYAAGHYHHHAYRYDEAFCRNYHPAGYDHVTGSNCYPSGYDDVTVNHCYPTLGHDEPAELDQRD